MTAISPELVKTSVGRYWRNKKASLRELAKTCRDVGVSLACITSSLPTTSFSKQADIGGEQEESFEQAFSSLAYGYLKEKAPRLIDFIVGFQLVERNDDNSKAVGVFGFKVGQDWYYGPVFFLNGDLKGHELLYIKKQDIFVPMKENWINHLINRKAHILGKPSQLNTNQLGGQYPNLSRMVSPPSSTKFGMAGWVSEFEPVLGAIAADRHDLVFNKDAELLPRLDLGSFLADAGFSMVKLAHNVALEHPLIKEAFDKFYGTDFWFKVGNDLLNRAKEAEEKTKSVLDGVTRPEEGLFDRVKQASHPVHRGQLQFIRFEDVFHKNAAEELVEEGSDLDDSEKEKLVKDKVLIRDHRIIDNVSVAYDSQVQLELTNPDSTGIYDVVEIGAELTPMVVIKAPLSGRGHEGFCLVIRKENTKSWKNFYPQSIWVKQNTATPTEFEEWVKSLGSSSSLKVGGTYAAVDSNGTGTCAFHVDKALDDGHYSVSWEDYASRPRNAGRTYAGKSDPDDYSSWDAIIRINPAKGSSIKRTIDNIVHIPESCKFITLKSPPEPKKDDEDIFSECCGSDPDADSKVPINLGSATDIRMMLTEKTSSLTLFDTGVDVFITSKTHGTGPVKKAEVLKTLICTHGFCETQARAMIKAAEAARVHRQKVSYLVKYAEPYQSSLQTGIGAPMFPEPAYGQEQVGTGMYPATYSDEQFESVPGMDASTTDQEIYNPFYRPDPKAMQVAQQASQSGQKEIFDTAMFAGLLKTTKHENFVDRYIGDLMKALDRIGRILLLFFWHQEEFSDRYGEQDMPELEDTLRNAFEIVGDLTLFLKEKTVQGGAVYDRNFNSSGPDISAAASV